jgi:hypothetical protein
MCATDVGKTYGTDTPRGVGSLVKEKR